MINEETIEIKGMSCGHCVMAVDKELQKLDLENVKVDIGTAKVKYDDNKVSREEIVKAIDTAGYDVVK